VNVKAAATRGLLLLALAWIAVLDVLETPQFWTRVLGFLPVLICYVPVVFAAERRATSQRYTSFAWVSVFTLFAIGLLVGESAPTLLAVLLLGGVVATTRDRLTGVLIGALAAGTALYLGRQDPTPGSERFYLGLCPILMLTGLYCGLLVRSADQAWEESENLREELADQAEQINYVLACVASGVLVVDVKLKILTFNRAAERILGLPEHTVVGRELSAIPTLASLGEIFETSPPSTDSTESTPRNDLEFTRPDGGRIWVGYAVSRLENRAALQLGFVLVFQDVTLIRDYASRMLQQEQLAALGRMVSGIAHEFGNILGGARGLVELAMLDEPEEAVEILPVVKETLSRALETVDNLLRFARGTPLNRVPGVEPHAVLERALILLTADLERGSVNVETDFQDVTPLQADAIQLEQVFINLIINAVHAVDGQDDRRLKISVTPSEDGRVVIRFEDSGPGIPKEVLGRVFEPFFTTKGSLGGSKVPGTGLGLSIALGVIEGHDGTISASVSPDLTGACFTISLPSTNLDAPLDS
jgi:PAS domain S-box-containing protein